MPLPIALAHALARRLAAVRRDGTLAYLGPDGKTQVTVEYRGGRPVRVAAVVVSAQHAPGVAPKRLEADIRERVVAAAIPPEFLDARTACHINPGGPFTTGGPAAEISGGCGRGIATFSAERHVFGLMNRWPMMKNYLPLIQALIDALIVLEFAGSDEINPDTAVRAMEHIAASLSTLDPADQLLLRGHLHQIAADAQDHAYKEFISSLPDVLGLVQ